MKKRDSEKKKNTTWIISEKNTELEVSSETEIPKTENLRDLRVAAILGRELSDGLGPECCLTALSCVGWKKELEESLAELLLIESVKEDNAQWEEEIRRCGAILSELTDFCHEKQIPVVFWDTEKPDCFGNYLFVANKADLVFTVDAEKILKYRMHLCHDKVFHLHFAAQPAVSNLIGRYPRSSKIGVSESLFQQYKEHWNVLPCSQQNGILDCICDEVADFKRNAYVAVMNPVTQNQTYFAPEVFHAIASNTMVVSNYCRGVKNYFGDLVLCTDDTKTFLSDFYRNDANKYQIEKLRLLALRKVLSEHLYEDRLAAIAEKLFPEIRKTEQPSVCVLAWVTSQEEANRVREMCGKQSYRKKQLLLISDASISDCEPGRVIPKIQFDREKAGIVCQSDYLACFSAEDWYGSNYILDLILATRLGDFDAIGKAEYLLSFPREPIRCGKGKEYQREEAIALRRMILKTQLVAESLGATLHKNKLWNANTLSVDALNYCENWKRCCCEAAEDLILPDQGVPVEIREKTYQNLRKIPAVVKTQKYGVDVIASLDVRKESEVSVEKAENVVLVKSSRTDEIRRYVYLPNQFEVKEYAEKGSLEIVFRGRSEKNINCYCIFFSDAGERLDTKSVRLGVKTRLTLPQRASLMKVSYQVFGMMSFELENIEFGEKIAEIRSGGCLMTRSNVLVLTDHYPAPQDLYRNMFVHKRVTAYKEKGLLVDVMRMNPFAVDCVREFEGINVIEGHADTLDAILKNGSIDTVCVHFLNQDMWNVLKQYLRSVRLIVWSHGADIQPWWRRTFNYQTEEELEKAKRASESRMALWHEVFAASETTDIQFVFVSRFAANQVMEDYQTVLPEGKYHVIHNCIDTEQFAYVPKKPEDRKKLLSIRPYASRKYANDLMVNAILELSKDPWFPELEIALYGNGPLFDELLAPLQKFSNIHIEKKYFTQSEIAELHKQYGVFLTATREDTHGVSRDEAMSSGLVVVTNAVTAIPEFTDDSCAMLSPADDYLDMADKLRQLYRDPELYLKISENAAKRVRSQTSREYTIDKEIQLIWS